MKFAHMADCHIGGWRDPKLSGLSTDAFERAISICREENVDFILIAGDLFNTALPGIDHLKRVTQILRSLKIPVYLIPGSHDYSPSGKTMLDVLEHAGLFINVSRGDAVDGKLRLKFVTDPKTGVKITGILGKMGGLETEYYKRLDFGHLHNEQEKKLFLFHTAIEELKPKELETINSMPASFLPRGFDYYAGGHVHIVKQVELEGCKNIVYPGPLFPNSFSELEKLKQGGFYIVEDFKPRFVPIEIRLVKSAVFNCECKIPEDVERDVEEWIKNNDTANAIVTMRFQGTLREGRPGQIRFKELFDKADAYFIMRNTLKLSSAEFQEIAVPQGSVEEVEKSIIEEHTGKGGIFTKAIEKEMIRKLMQSFDAEREEGERVSDFEEKIIQEGNALFMGQRFNN